MGIECRKEVHGGEISSSDICTKKKAIWRPWEVKTVKDGEEDELGSMDFCLSKIQVPSQVSILSHSHSSAPAHVTSPSQILGNN